MEEFAKSLYSEHAEITNIHTSPKGLHHTEVKV